MGPELEDTPSEKPKEKLLCLHCWEGDFLCALIETEVFGENFRNIRPRNFLICKNCGSMFYKDFLKPKTELEIGMHQIGFTGGIF